MVEMQIKQVMGIEVSETSQEVTGDGETMEEARVMRLLKKSRL
jgi:hypothetical protein